MADISPDSLASVKHLSNILRLFHHRNKNQHRHGIWWRHFSAFRKNLDRLVGEYERLQAIPATHLARMKKNAHDVRTRSSIESRIIFWQDVAVAKWQNAFSQLVADGQFAVMGLVLVAALGEACKMLGITARLDELGQEEVEKVLDEFAAEAWEDSKDGERVELEDVGEVVSRPAISGGDQAESDDLAKPFKPRAEKSTQVRSNEKLVIADERGTKRKSSTEKPVKKKKRKKGGDAIDDLFSGL